MRQAILYVWNLWDDYYYYYRTQFGFSKLKSAIFAIGAAIKYRGEDL